MEEKTKILYIAPELSESCGVTRHVVSVLAELSNSSFYELHFITNSRSNALNSLKNSGIHTKIIPFRCGDKNPFYFFISFLMLLRYCIGNRIDVIHSHHRVPELLSVLVSKFIRIKTITTVHSFLKGFKWLSFKSDVVIAVSESVKSFLLDNYSIKDSSIFVRHNFIMPMQKVDDSILRNIRLKYNIESESTVVLFVGRVCVEKGVDILVDAFSKIDNTNAKLIIVGKYTKEFKDLLCKDSNSKVIFVGPSDFVSCWYSIADIVVLPSMSETFGYVMAEAGYFSRAFIGTKVGGVLEIVYSGINGILIDVGDSESLCLALSSLIENPKLRHEYGQQLRKSIEHLINPADYINFLQSLYKKKM